MKKKNYPNEGSPVDELLGSLEPLLSDVGLDPVGHLVAMTITMDNGQKVHGVVDALQTESSRFFQVDTSYTESGSDGLLTASMVLVDVNKISTISVKNNQRIKNGVVGPHSNHSCPG